MTLTILFDLDDTLLLNNMDSFQPAYLEALARHLSHRVKGDVLIRNLLYSTQKMLQNSRPDRTLEQVFDSYFYPAIGVRREEIQPEIDTFYTEVFPTLQPLTSARPEAIHLIEWAFRRGYQLAIATNPLFPKTAIIQRLGWAGLPVTYYPFSLVPSYETFHFAKPNPAFFNELLAQLGWPEGPWIMIGNDLENDTAPARKAGFFTYWIDENQDSGKQAWDNPYYQGSFRDISAWLERFEENHPHLDGFSPVSMTSTLLSTPAALDTLVRRLPTTHWLDRPATTEWCLTEILCHLRDVTNEVDIPRIEKVLQEDNPFIPGMITDPWADERHYCTQDGAEALRGFTDARLKLIDLLTTLSPSDWERPARHAIFGPTKLRELVSFTITHDKSHIQQCLETIKTVTLNAAAG